MQGGYPAGSQPPDPNLPQPPQEQQLNPQPQQGPTLGQANGDPSGLPPGNPVLDQYNQAIAGTLAMMKQQGLVRDPVPPQPGPGILESLGTFGMANLKHIADENTRREENYRILQENRKNALTGIGLATKMVDAQVAGSTLAQRQNIALQGLSLRQQEFLNTLMEQQAKHAREKVNDEFKFGTEAPATTAEGADLQQGRGLVPSARFPTRLTKNPDTGAWQGGAPGSAVDTTMKQVGGGGGGGRAPTAGPQPNESPQDYARRKTREEKPISGQAQKDVTSIDQSVMDAQEIERLAQDPEVQKYMGPVMGRIAKGLYTGGVQVNPKVSRYIQKVEFLRAAAVGPLLHGSRNPQVWKQIQAHLPQTGDRPDLAMEKLKGLSDLYKTNREILLQDSAATPGDLSATSDTPTSTTPPSTGAPTQGTPSTGVTPSGIRFRVIGQ